jgi:hypothetical protein
MILGYTGFCGIVRHMDSGGLHETWSGFPMVCDLVWGKKQIQLD